VVHWRRRERLTRFIQAATKQNHILQQYAIGGFERSGVSAVQDTHVTMEDMAAAKVCSPSISSSSSSSSSSFLYLFLSIFCCAQTADPLCALLLSSSPQMSENEIKEDRAEMMRRRAEVRKYVARLPSPPGSVQSLDDVAGFHEIDSSPKRPLTLSLFIALTEPHCLGVSFI